MISCIGRFPAATCCEPAGTGEVAVGDVGSEIVLMIDAQHILVMRDGLMGDGAPLRFYA